MRDHRLIYRVLLLGLLIGLFPLTAAAVTYLFEVPEMTIDLWPQTDGALRVKYQIAFKNLSSDALDIVDIGTPTADYALSSFKASLDGHALNTIRKSSYVTGVEIPLENYAIKQGRAGTLTVEFTQPRMVYYDEDNEQYTSAEFGNTYFGEQYARGTMDLTMRWHFPPGVTGNETKYHRVAPTSMETPGDHLVFVYRNSAASPSKMEKYGVGFPARIMQPGAIVKVTLLDDCFALVGACFGLLGVCAAPLFFIGFIGFFIFLAVYRRRRRMKKYLPPTIGIEGVGVKRGLTAPQAATLLELPPDKVLMMILFGLLKKGAVHAATTPALLLRKVDPTPSGLNRYETDFLEAVDKKGGLDEDRLRGLFTRLIKAVNGLMKGFSLKETRQYYRQIVMQAWRQVETAQTPEVGAQFSESADWLALDDDFEKRARLAFGRHDTVTMPFWWSYGWGMSTTPTVAGGTPTGNFSIPGADAAHNFLSALGDFSHSAFHSISDFTASVTRLTNPPPVQSSSGGHSGGGCACACAGCACACAGGGR